MRAVGLFSRDRTAIDRFTDQWRGMTHNGAGAAVRVRRWPADAPLLVVAEAIACNPPLQWAERPDGSFALLDGEVFGTNGAIGPAAGRDAAALLALYAAQGAEGIGAMNGSAALAIFDAGRRSLLLFRDRYGQAPAFYAERPEGLYWASDLPSLLRTGVPGTLDLRALDFFLSAGYVPAPWTFVEEIRKVPPAHYLYRGENSPGEVKRYWTMTGRPKLTLSRAETAERLGALIEQAVRRQAVPGGRTGVLLSGGVDSALLVGCLASRLQTEVEAFTFRYGAYEGELNEFDAAHETAVHFQAPHHAIDYGPSDVSDNIERMAQGYGEPFLWGMHTFKLGRVAESGVGAVFSGVGADSGTIRPLEDKIMSFRRLPAPVRGLTAATVPAIRLFHSKLAARAQLFLRCADGCLPVTAVSGGLSDVHRRRVYRDPGLVDSSRRAADALLDSMRRDIVVEESDRDRLIFLRQRLFIAECNLFWNQAWARTHNLALRHPYNDNDLQDFVMRLPRINADKEDLRRYAATVLPQDKAYARKFYHRIPLGHWFRGPLRGFLQDQLAGERLNRQGVFEPGAVSRLVDEHQSGRIDHIWRLLAILSFTVWHDTVLKSARVGGS
ncbi:MAG: asparagine synthetase B [Dongiaceae bacterium]